MAHGENAENNGNHAGRDYWSKRHPSTCVGWGGWGKYLTRRLERRKAKKIIKEELKEVDSNGRIS